MKIKLFFVSMLCAVALCSTAQIIINRVDLGNFIGVNVIQANDTTNLNLLSPGNAGVSQTWNLSGIGNDYPDTMNFFAPSAGPCSSSFPAATLAGSQNGSQGDFFFYMIDDNTKLEMIGLCGVFMAPDTSIVPLVPPQKQLSFPSTYNTAFSGQTKEILKIPNSTPPPDSIKMIMTISYSSLIDGWGTVTTPAGSFNSLRQKVTKFQTDSIFVYTTLTGWVSAGAPTIDTTIEYSWLSQTNPFIAGITVDAQGVVQSAKYLLSSNIGVNEISNNSGAINVFPNPSNGKLMITVNAGNAYIIDVYNAMGAKVYSNTSVKGQTSCEVDISQCRRGIYFVNVFDGVKYLTEKIIIQ
ncbi:MAG: T9SS type A sorting domain-containing protein [Bacteroidota bacterium]